MHDCEALKGSGVPDIEGVGQRQNLTDYITIKKLREGNLNEESSAPL